MSHIEYNDKYLRILIHLAHKALKDELKNEFNKSILKMKKEKGMVEHEDHHTEIQNSSSIKPYFYEDDRFVAYFYRLNLLQDAEVDIDEETRVLTIEITNHPTLTESEKKKSLLHLIHKYKEFNVFKQSEADSTTVFQYYVPEKARLDTIERNDFDSEYGWVVEILLEKRQAIDKTKLRGKPMSHVQLTVKTTVALANQKEGNTNEDQSADVQGSQDDDD